MAERGYIISGSAVQLSDAYVTIMGHRISGKNYKQIVTLINNGEIRPDGKLYKVAIPPDHMTAEFYAEGLADPIRQEPINMLVLNKFMIQSIMDNEAKQIEKDIDMLLGTVGDKHHHKPKFTVEEKIKPETCYGAENWCSWKYLEEVDKLWVRLMIEVGETWNSFSSAF